jgi:hypothetical protein
MAFIVHLKNKLPICGTCRNQVVPFISAHLRTLPLNLPVVGLVNNLQYRQPMKGVYLTANLLSPGGVLSLPINRVIQPIPGGVPIPAVNAAPPAPPQQTVRIVFIIGSAFKNVDIFE